MAANERGRGFGRYDVMLEPIAGDGQGAAMIMEFMVRRPKREKSLDETLAAALHQIEEKEYEAALKAKGISCSL